MITETASLSPVPAVRTAGVLNIHKPVQLTSFAVVRRIRSILHEKKVGHCGTLDPMAEGVLVVLFGAATARSSEFMAGRKIYRGEIRMGLRTDTGDATGMVLEACAPPVLHRATVEEVFHAFTGEIEQVPPMFSALKHNGRKLYDWAREGVEVERAPRKVTIHSLELLDLAPDRIRFRVACSKGLYVRTLAEDIGARLGAPATLSALVREGVGDFSIDQSLAWDRVLAMSREDLLSKAAPA